MRAVYGMGWIVVALAAWELEEVRKQAAILSVVPAAGEDREEKAKNIEPKSPAAFA